MRKLWRFKLFHFIIFILIASSLRVITIKLDTLQFVLQNGNLTLENNTVMHLIKDIKTVRVVAIIL